MKLGRTSPCAKSSAIHWASLTSVLRPGTALLWAALSSQTSKVPSRRLKTGFQSSPVLSKPMWVQPPSASQSERRNSSLVVVPKVRVSASRVPCASRVSRQTTTVRLWTSMPAQRSNTMSMTHSLSSRFMREGRCLAPGDDCLACRPRGAAREPHGHRNEQHLTYALALASASAAAASGSCRCPGPTVQQASRTQSHADLCVAPSPVQPIPFSCLRVSDALMITVQTEPE
jgi:hypothetical protein